MKKTILITLICVFIFLVVVESYIIGYGYYKSPGDNTLIRPEDRELYLEKSPEFQANLEADVKTSELTDKSDGISDNASNEIEKDYLEKNGSVGDFSVDTKYEYITDSKLKNQDLAIVTTDKNIYVKIAGKWTNVPKTGIKEYAYFTCCEIVNINDDTFIFAATSFSGIFYKSLKAKNFTQLTEGLKPPFATNKNLFYFETINRMFINNDYLYAGYAYSGGIQRINLREKTFKAQDTSIQLINDTNEKVNDFYFLNNTLFADTKYAVYSFTDEKNTWDVVKKKDAVVQPAENSVRGIYLNPYGVSSTSKIDKYVKLANDLGLNAFVIDFKDDYGYVDYDCQVELAKKMKAVKKIVKLDYLLEKCKLTNIKVIARLVSFKDGIAYDYNKNEFALWDVVDNKAWEGSKGEKWVDAYNETYQQYLLDIAKELEQKGVDEIQFDYVRFPSDGQIFKVKFRYKNEIKSKNILLYSFFKKAKSEIKIPVSADFYGYNSWYKMHEYIGQDIFLASNYLDAVYPMYYPSHFSQGFYQKNLTQYETNFYIYYHGTRRAFDNVQKNTQVRPWIQVFKMKVDISYTDYIKSQLYGITNAGIDSFIFWNAGCDYKILYDIL